MRTQILVSTMMVTINVCPSQAASPVHAWSKSFAGPYDFEHVNDAAIDNTGNIVVTGSFDGTLDLGGGVLTALSSSGDIFVAKFTAAGEHIWSRRIGGTGGAYGNRVAVDAAGDIVVSGGFRRTVDFGSGIVLTSSKRTTTIWSPDAFLLKLDANGTTLWARRFGDEQDREWCEVATDAANNIWVVVDHQGRVNFGGGALVSVGGLDIFAAKLDPNGNHVWSRRFGGLGDDYASFTCNRTGDIVLSGVIRSETDFGCGSLTPGEYNFFIAKLDDAGTCEWSQLFGGPSNQVALDDLALHDSGDMVAVGVYWGAVDFGGGVLPDGNMFLAKLDRDGSHVWSKGIEALPYQGIDGGAMSIDVAMDGSGNVTIASTLMGIVDFGGGPLTFASLDVGMAQFDVNGNYVWSQRFGGDWNDFSSCLATTDDGSVVVGGEFETTIDFGGGILGHSDAGISELFLAKFQPDVALPVSDHRFEASLMDNYPNPFNPRTSIRYSLAKKSFVAIEIINVRGALVRRIDQGARDAGDYIVEWDGRDDAGSAVASGVYFYRLEGVIGIAPRKMVLLK